MIKLGDGWIAEEHRIFHECGAGVRVELIAAREFCDCGAPVPRRVRHFESWLAGKRHGLFIYAPLDDSGVIEIEESEPET